MNKFLFSIFLFVLPAAVKVTAQIAVKGRVVSSADNSPLSGAAIKIKRQSIGVSSNADGSFNLNVKPSDTLIISYTGYHTLQIIPSLSENLIVRLDLLTTSLEEVIVSTGYQSLPKERATGSFVKIDNELLNRSVSTGLIDRLKDVVPGLSFNRLGNSAISIRGQSTIYGNAQPLIVIDNFPYDGDLLDINPNDVESITVLKDAAAASIWGARAGNGVIVITTKKGRLNTPLRISANSNVTIGSRPDVYSDNRLSSADYIGIEKRLFSEGYYDAAKASGYQPLTPVIELLYEKDADPSKTADADARIEALKSQDVRKDFEKYFYQTSLYQQYALNMNGGSAAHSYYISAGHDRNRESLVNNGYRRMSLSAENTFNLFRDKLRMNTGISLIYNRDQNDNPGTSAITNATAGGAIYPYAKLADGEGNPLPVVKNYSNSLIESAMADGLLDWSYSPLQEIRIADNVTKRRNVRLNTGLLYKIWNGLNASLQYQYQDISSTGRNYYGGESYFARDLINRFTQVNGSALIRPVPLGGILDRTDQLAVTNIFRGQLDFNRQFITKHEVSAIAGYEVRMTKTESHSYRYYGYDAEHATSGIVDYTDVNLPYYYDSSRKGQIPNVDATGLYNDRYRSYYANASYTYDRRITVSGSGRIDQSNLFGVKTNQKGVPLWSAGVSWNLSNERFYDLRFLPVMKLRLTYGYNGSVNKSVSAYTTASLTGLNLYQLPYATIINPPNPELRWERVKVLNTGIDFGTKGERLTGSLEYYHKQGIDLIGDTPFPPSSGITLFRGNTAGTSGNGMDVTLSSKNTTGALRWNTDAILSHITEKITDYKVTASVYNYIQSGLYVPLEGRPLYSLYSYQWAGLDPSTGDPLGYLNGVVSKDYAAILNTITPQNMIFNGSLRPTTFGSVRNSFSYKGWDLSFNVVYRLGYYYRKSSVSYSNNYGLSSNNGDYALRWQKPGDEDQTIVPSIPATANNNRDMFYRYSEALADKADNIRLQDIRAGYALNKVRSGKLPFKSAEIYAYANNIGLIWKAARFDMDPENQRFNLPFTFSLGLKLTMN